jgi:hypothetical protein
VRVRENERPEVSLSIIFSGYQYAHSAFDRQLFLKTFKEIKLEEA